jgi:hypothetical protein
MISISTNDKLRIDYAFELIAKANTVTTCSLGEMQAIIMRALAGEFDSDILIGRNKISLTEHMKLTEPLAQDILNRIATRYKNCGVRIFPNFPELTPVEAVLRCAKEEGFVLTPR